MKAFLFNTLKLIALALFSWILAMYLAWPVWGGLVIFLGVIGAWLGFKLIKRLWLVTRSRAKLAASEAYGRARANAPAGLNSLNQKWKQAIAALRRSSLRRYGNPIYALPWYMVVGQSGSGKTAAIVQSRPGSLTQGTAAADSTGPTENCEWWFLNRAVILDTTGRYVAADPSETDQAEWDRMLELLAKHRLKEGLNGLVLCVTADQLMNTPVDGLVRQGQALRERINQLIRLFDKRFPIHLLITHCDHIPGFESWTQALAAGQLSQAMGYTGAPGDGEGAEVRFVDQAMDQITARLKRQRLDLSIQGCSLDADLLLFPDEVERLRTGLKQFLTASMGNSPYLEQPLLRGLHLSSAAQDGRHWPDILNNQAGQSTAPPARKGLFLHDVFEYVLPAERWAHQPTVIIDRWRLATRNLAIVTWICLCAAALVFLLLSYYQTRSSLRDIENAYPALNASQQDQLPEQRLEGLQDMLRIIDLIHRHEQHWESRWLAFSPDLDELEDDIKTQYVDGYYGLLQKNRRDFIAPALQDDSPDNAGAFAKAILTLTRNINQTQARIDGADYQQLLDMPQAPEQVTAMLGLELPASLDDAPAHMSAAFKAWSSPDDPWLRDSLTADRNALQQALDKIDHLVWLLHWADHQADLTPVTLRDFWMPGSQGPNEGVIPPSMTQAGRQRIEALLDEIGQALNQSTDFQFKRGAFEAWYASERVNAWRSFAWSFSNGEQLLTNEPAWRDMVTRVDTIVSPYYQFFDRLRSEFAQTPATELPDWLLFAREFSTQKRAVSENISLDKAAAVLQTINSIGTRIIHASDQSQTAAAGTTLNRSIQGVQAFSDYTKQFDAAAAQALEGTGQSYQLAADYFSLGTDPKAANSALQATQDSLDAFRRASGFDQPDDQIIWMLVGGPLRILTLYTLEQASCHAQQAWEHDVLWKTQLAVSPREANDQLFGDQGSVWGFADGPLKPFIQRQAGGFSPVRRADYSLPLNGDFLPFLNRSVNTRVESVVKTKQAEAMQGKTANILITARPLGVNEGAKAQPYAATLSIQCSQEEITLDNFNMAVTNSFDWSPDQCGDVTLRVDIDDITLTQRYPGPMGMARFVADFKDGEHIFTPNDFPQAQSRLEALDVRTLHVRYDFTGANQLLSMAEHLDYLADTQTPAVGATPARSALKVPERVGQCWTAGIPRQQESPLPLYIRQRAEKQLAPPPAPPAPPPPAEAAKPVPPAPAPSPQRTHRVTDGDTLYSIARHYKTHVQTLQELNHLKDSNLIKKGQLLTIPPENHSAQ